MNVYGYTCRIPVLGVAFSVAICRLDAVEAAELAAAEETVREANS